MELACVYVIIQQDYRTNFTYETEGSEMYEHFPN